MAATIIGTIATNDHVLQKRTGTQNRFGLINMRETWLINSADVFTGAIPAYQTVHTDFAYLFLQDATFDYIGTSLCRVSVVYEGAILGGGGGTTTSPLYSLQVGTMTAPITQHPLVDGWIYSEIAAGRDPLDSAGLFQAWKLGAVSSGSQSLYGLDQYETPAVFWSKEWVASTGPDATDIGLVGAINTPDGSPPTPTDSNWLCIDNSFREIGAGMYARTKRWKLSQANAGGGWNSDVY